MDLRLRSGYCLEGKKGKTGLKVFVRYGLKHKIMVEWLRILEKKLNKEVER